jgi:hypothetical protein
MRRSLQIPRSAQAVAVPAIGLAAAAPAQTEINKELVLDMSRMVIEQKNKAGVTQ